MKQKPFLIATLVSVTLVSLLILNSSMKTTKFPPTNRKSEKTCSINISVVNSSTSTVKFTAGGAVSFGPTTLGSGGSSSWSGTVASSPANIFLNAQVITGHHAAGRARIIETNTGNVIACQNVPANYTDPIIFSDDIFLDCGTQYTFEYKQGVSCPN